MSAEDLTVSVGKWLSSKGYKSALSGLLRDAKLDEKKVRSEHQRKGGV